MSDREVLLRQLVPKVQTKHIAGCVVPFRGEWVGMTLCLFLGSAPAPRFLGVIGDGFARPTDAPFSKSFDQLFGKTNGRTDCHYYLRGSFQEAMGYDQTAPASWKFALQVLRDVLDAGSGTPLRFACVTKQDGPVNLQTIPPDVQLLFARGVPLHDAPDEWRRCDPGSAGAELVLARRNSQDLRVLVRVDDSSGALYVLRMIADLLACHTGD